jgi:hypothetical protein
MDSVLRKLPHHGKFKRCENTLVGTDNVRFKARQVSGARLRKVGNTFVILQHRM